MNKKEFVNAVNAEDEMEVAKLYEKMELCLKTDQTIFSDKFYPPNIWKSIEDMNLRCKVWVKGINPDAQRKLIIFSDIYTENIYDFPIELLEIKNMSKFSELGHRDYLGALMSLGIKRKKLSDLLVDGDSCYLLVFEDVKDYIIRKLDKIGNNPCKIYDRGLNFDIVPDYKYEEGVVLASSLRLDAVIKDLANCSRSDSVDLIESGKVKVDYIEVNQKSFSIKLPVTIIIRGEGKFKLEKVIGESKSGRYKILSKKFI